MHIMFMHKPHPRHKDFQNKAICYTQQDQVLNTISLVECLSQNQSVVVLVLKSSFFPSEVINISLVSSCVNEISTWVSLVIFAHRVSF